MEVLTYFISLFQILNLSIHGLHFFLGGFPFPPDSHTPLPQPPSWAFLFPPGFPTPSPGPLGPPLSSRIPIPCSGPHGCLLFPFGYPLPAPGSLEGSTYFYCSGYKTQVFSGSLPHASLMIPVRQSWDKGQKVVCQKCAAIQRRVVATLGAVLNDRTGAGSFAARRTTNEEPP